MQRCTMVTVPGVNIHSTGVKKKKKSIWTRVILVMTVLMLVLVTACEQPVVDMKPTEPEQKPTPVPGVKPDGKPLLF